MGGAHPRDDLDGLAGTVPAGCDTSCWLRSSTGCAAPGRRHRRSQRSTNGRTCRTGSPGDASVGARVLGRRRFRDVADGRQRAHRARVRRADVAQFVRWAERGGCPEPGALDHATLRRYLAYLTTRGFAKPTIARKAAAIRAFLRYLTRRRVRSAPIRAGRCAPRRGRAGSPRAHADRGGARCSRPRAPRSRPEPTTRPLREPDRGRPDRGPRGPRGPVRHRRAGLGVLRARPRRRRPRPRTRHGARQGRQGPAGPTRRPGRRRRLDVARATAVRSSRPPIHPLTRCS